MQKRIRLLQITKLIWYRRRCVVRSFSDRFCRGHVSPGGGGMPSSTKWVYDGFQTLTAQKSRVCPQKAVGEAIQSSRPELARM